MNDVKVYSFNLNYSDFIRLNLQEKPEHDNFSTFLVDSQADVCIIKLNSLSNTTLFDKNEIISIKGVTTQNIFSLGTVKLNLNFENVSIRHKFHVVSDEFDIPSDGILGRDFLHLYNCTLCYYKNNFVIRTCYENITIELSNGLSEDEFILPPRSEVFRICKVKAEKFPSFIKSQDVDRDVHVANTVVHSERSLVRIINTSDEHRRIRKLEIEAVDIDTYNIYKFSNIEDDQDRKQKLIDILRNKVAEPHREELLELCEKFSDIFALDTDKMSTNNFYTQKIRLSDDIPVYTPNYRTPHYQKAEIDKQIKKLIDNELVEPSVSPYNSPVILVPKKSNTNEKKWRLCIDYSRVNKKIIADRYPMPRIDDILEGLGRAIYFSIMDLYSGFHQVPIEESSREITSFNTSQGAYRWKVLPFGLSISPNSFQRMMNIAFTGLTPEKAFLYVDDIIVIGRSEKHHFHNLKTVFERLRQYNLKINPEKCKFFQTEVIFLGHKCTSAGILPDDSKLKAVKNFPTPKNKDEVKRFVAFANYYRKFIQDFAKISAPLSNLTRKRIDFVWTDETQNAFEKLKKSLLKPQILQYPDFTKKFKITVDASDIACGGVLSQDFDGNDLPIAFFSRVFQKGEKNKAIIEKELLAIYHSIKFFKPYVYGAKFEVNSDHKPLTYLFKMKNPTSKLVRIRMDLEDFDFEINYVPGQTNFVADALSRVIF